MEQFILKSERGARVTFHSRQYDENRWLKSYFVDFEAPDFRASVQVENPGCGHPPSQLFQKLAAQWSGWKGSEEWGSLEGELEIEAICDATGHVKLTFKVPGYGEFLCWSASVWVAVEAGQLEQLAREANAFFVADA
jgi:Family of unknown function (DUF6228)